jgi:Ca2+-binding EF-hand superfamily protein
MVEPPSPRKFMFLAGPFSLTVHLHGSTAARMALGAFLIAMLAAAPPVPNSTPIMVTGHPWAPFISPMGEPFRPKNRNDDTLADWFTQADRNHDGVLTSDEMVADAERYFAKLDTNHDGQIDPDELAQYEYQIAPEIQVNSRTKRLPGQPVAAPRNDDSDLYPDDSSAGRREERRKRGEDFDSSLGIGGALQGAARYSLLNIPEPVAAADTDFNRAITLAEFRQAAIDRFQLLDSRHQGRVSLAQLEAMPHAPDPNERKHKIDEKARDARVGNTLPPGP